MTEQEIFDRLFSIVQSSDDTDGVVAACLVRNGQILVEGVSTSSGKHAEYVVLEKLRDQNIEIEEGDILYTTVEPCGKRTPGGPGEKFGSCTTNIIRAGIKHVVYGASYDESSAATRHKFKEASISLTQTSDPAIISKSIESYNSTQSDPAKHLPG